MSNINILIVFQIVESFRLLKLQFKINDSITKLNIHIFGRILNCTLQSYLNAIQVCWLILFLIILRLASYRLFLKLLLSRTEIIIKIMS